MPYAKAVEKARALRKLGKTEAIKKLGYKDVDKIKRFLWAYEAGNSTMKSIIEFWEESKSIFPECADGFQRIIAVAELCKNMEDTYDFEVWLDSSIFELLNDCEDFLTLLEVWFG